MYRSVLSHDCSGCARSTGGCTTDGCVRVRLEAVWRAHFRGGHVGRLDHCLRVRRSSRLFLDRLRDAQPSRLHQGARYRPGRGVPRLPRDRHRCVLLLRLIRCLARPWFGRCDDEEGLLRHRPSWSRG